jgi:hypothetical protein
MKDNEYIYNNKYTYNNIYDGMDKIDKINDDFRDKYLIEKFMDLFQNQRIASPSSQNPYGTTQPAEEQVQDQRGKFIAENRWKGPMSFEVENIYEWMRGVAGIREDGYVVKSSLDDDSYHHGDETIRVIRALGGNAILTSSPFEAGIIGSEKGYIIFQSEGDNAFVYFPHTITNEQYKELYEMITPRNGYNFSFTHNEKIFESKSVDDVLDYALTIISLGIVRA